MNDLGGPGELGDIVREFLVEGRENLDQLDQDVVALEREPAAPDRLSSVFRNVHTPASRCWSGCATGCRNSTGAAPTRCCSWWTRRAPC